MCLPFELCPKPSKVLIMVGLICEDCFVGIVLRCGKVFVSDGVLWSFGHTAFESLVELFERMGALVILF